LHSSLELNETAYLLGYEGANSFFRAFHQWEGTSPGEWRAVHAHASAASKWPMVELFFWTRKAPAPALLSCARKLAAYHLAGIVTLAA
jgi:hypothetical protein